MVENIVIIRLGVRKATFILDFSAHNGTCAQPADAGVEAVRN